MSERYLCAALAVFISCLFSCLCAFFSTFIDDFLYTCLKFLFTLGFISNVYLVSASHNLFFFLFVILVGRSSIIHITLPSSGYLWTDGWVATVKCHVIKRYLLSDWMGRLGWNVCSRLTWDNDNRSQQLCHWQKPSEIKCAESLNNFNRHLKCVCVLDFGSNKPRTNQTKIDYAHTI